MSVMTAPQHAVGLDGNATHSDTTTKTNFDSPAISISPITDGSHGRRVSSTNQSSGFSSSQAGPLPLQSAYTLNGQSVVPSHQSPTQFTKSSSDFDQPPQSFYGIRTGTSDQQNRPFAGAPYSTLTASTIQPWISPRNPYLSLSPWPHYEPTGELVNEQIDNLFEFDDPSRIRTRTGQTIPEPEFGPRQQDQSGNLDETSNLSSQVHPSKSPDGISSNRLPTLPPKSALKRKADTDEGNIAGPATSRTPARPPAKLRSVSFEQMSARDAGSPEETSHRTPGSQARGGANFPAARRGRPSISSSTPKAGAETDTATPRPIRGVKHPSGHPPSILPPEKVFPIQIGSDLFRLSGASISSDAPSYFTQFFEEQIRENSESGGVRTLYIDRDPATFRDVARHLQGYYVKPQDGSHFVKLFADAQFYSLPRLIDQLFESEIFIQIGERHFQIPKDIFSEPGNSPNFFSLGFAVFFSTPGEVFPGLDRRGLLRPPSITPPYVPNRSAEVFAELLHLLRGYPLKVRDENHRQELLRDCRYFHLRGLEQKIIAHEISYNLGRGRQEIALRLEDVKPSGVSFRPNDDTDDDNDDNDENDKDDGDNSEAMMTDTSDVPAKTLGSSTRGWVNYARPFVDDNACELVIEIGSEQTQLDLRDMRVDFHGLTKARVSSLFQVVANKMNLPTNAPLGLMVLGQGGGETTTQGSSPGHTPLSEDRVKVRFEVASAITLDGEPFEVDWGSDLGRKMRFGPDATGSGSKQKDQEEEGDDDEGDGDDDDSSDSDEDMPDQQAQGQSSTAGQRTTSKQQQQIQQRQQQQQRAQAPGRPSSTSQPGSSGQHRSPHYIPPNVTATSGGKKRKRPSPFSTQPQHVPAAGTSSTQPYSIHQQSPTWTVKTGQYRLRIQPAPPDSTRGGGLEIVFVAVKIDAWRGERARNERRAFLGG